MKKILIASVLKAVNEPRMYQKFASTLKNNFEVHIVGFKATSALKVEKTIFFYPLFDFYRVSFKRVFVPFLFLKKAFQINPNYLIINTVELLIPALIFKLITQKKVIYDVRENYFANILYQNNYSPFLKKPLAFFVRLVENMSRLWISHYFLAENNYETECPFVKGKFTLIANKFKNTEIPIKENLKFNKKNTIQFLITGTLSQSYGTLEAIAFIQKIHLIDSNIKLDIVGYCTDKNYLKKINLAIKNCTFIRLIGGENAVPYPQILSSTAQSDVLLLPYLPNKSTQDCIPTKFYEAIAYRKTMLIQKNDYWQKLFQEYDVGIFINFQKGENNSLESSDCIKNVLQKIKNTAFYQKEIPLEFYSWQPEGEKMLNIVKLLDF